MLFTMLLLVSLTQEKSLTFPNDYDKQTKEMWQTNGPLVRANVLIEPFKIKDYPTLQYQTKYISSQDSVEIKIMLVGQSQILMHVLTVRSEVFYDRDQAMLLQKDINALRVDLLQKLV